MLHIQNAPIQKQYNRWQNTLHTRCLDRPWGFQEVQAPRVQECRHINLVRLSALRTGRLYPQEIYLVLTFVRTWIDQRATVQRGGLKHYLYLHFIIHYSCQVYHFNTAVRFITSIQLSGLSLQYSCQVYHFSTAVRFITSVQQSGFSLQYSCQVYHFSTAVRFITSVQLSCLSPVQFSGLSLQYSSEVYRFCIFLRFITSTQLSGLSLQYSSQVYHFNTAVRFITSVQ